MTLPADFINPEYEFEQEIEDITSEVHKEILKEALSKVPTYFFIVPASSSGKYHPKSSLGIGGLLRHVRSVFAVSEDLLRNPLFAPFTEDEKNDIRVAIILHDSAKQGLTDNPVHTLTEHPILVRQGMYPTKLSELDPGNQIDSIWDDICTIIESHMGVWNTDKEGNVVLPVPQTPVQKFMHLCDYIASRKIIDVDITSRKNQSSTGGSDDWKKAPATSSQVSYISKLMNDCKRKGIHVALTVEEEKALTKGQATDMIDEMKKLLIKVQN